MSEWSFDPLSFFTGIATVLILGWIGGRWQSKRNKSKP